VADAADAEETQVIAVQEPPPNRPRGVTDTAIDLEPVDDLPHLIPGFDRDEDEAERTQVLPIRGADPTQPLPASGAEADQTQPLPADEDPPPKRPGGRPPRGNRPGLRKRR
jgi:hypothetical protein